MTTAVMMATTSSNAMRKAMGTAGNGDGLWTMVEGWWRWRQRQRLKTTQNGNYGNDNNMNYGSTTVITTMTNGGK